MLAVNVMTRLKEATVAQHRAVEHALDLMREEVTLTDYSRYLTRMFGVHAPFEAGLARMPQLRALVPDLEQRSKTPLLLRDLQALGLRATVHAPLPPLLGTARALGALYVLEGSTLGGKIILRHLEKVLGARIASAHAYLAAYGAEVGPMWKRFSRMLDSSLHIDEAELVAGATEMFACIGDWLAREDIQG